MGCEYGHWAGRMTTARMQTRKGWGLSCAQWVALEAWRRGVRGELSSMIAM